MARVWTDLRNATRALSKRAGATAVAVSTLALGIGANTAIFSLLNALVLRSLPVPHPEQLVALATTISDNVNGDEPFALQMFDELSRRQRPFSELFVWNGGGINSFEADGRYFTAGLAEVSGNYYRGMQIRPLLGRGIEPADVALRSGASNPVAVISYRAWRNWYHADANIIGKMVRIGDHHPFTVVGVEPEGYSGLIIDGSADVTTPIFSVPQIGGANLRDPRLLWLRLYGRLKPGVKLPQARQSIGLLWPRILQATPPPGYAGEKRARFFARRIALEPAATGVSFLRKRFSYALRILMGLVGAVLLIACLNLANLTLARATARTHESGVRRALGANVWDLMRQPLIESFLLSFAGALLGLALAFWASPALLHIAWTGLVATPLTTAPDARVLAFTAAATIISGLLFAAAPVWHIVRADPIEALRQQTRSVRGGSNAAGRALLLGQMALSLILVIGAFLLGETLNQLHTVDVGYRRDHFLTMLLFPQAGHRSALNSVAYYRQLAGEMKRLPGVESASFSANGPASEFEFLEEVYGSLTGAPVQAIPDFVGPDFFHVAGMHLLNGREFSWQDDEHSPPVAIISQSLAERLFGHADPIGRTVYLGPHAHAAPMKIVGVVNSASLWKVESVHPMAIYQPIVENFADADPLMDVRTRVDPRSIKASAEQVVRAMGRQYSLRTMTVEERLDSYLSVQRLTALLAAFFGGTALLIAAIGLYGLMSLHVTRRTAELGIRLALGAQRGQVLSMVLREVLLLASVGCALGVAASLLLARLIGSALFGVSATDPVTLVAAVFTLLAVAVLAGFVPAKRAASVDPVAALRLE